MQLWLTLAFLYGMSTSHHMCKNGALGPSFNLLSTYEATAFHQRAQKNSTSNCLSHHRVQCSLNMKIQSMLLTASLALIASTSATSVAKTYDINVRPPPSLAKSYFFSNLGQFDERTIVPALPELNAVGIEDNIVRKCKTPSSPYTRLDIRSRGGHFTKPAM